MYLIFFLLNPRKICFFYLTWLKVKQYRYFVLGRKRSTRSTLKKFTMPYNHIPTKHTADQQRRLSSRQSTALVHRSSKGRETHKKRGLIIVQKMVQNSDRIRKSRALSVTTYETAQTDGRQQTIFYFTL